MTDVHKPSKPADPHSDEASDKPHRPANGHAQPRQHVLQEINDPGYREAQDAAASLRVDPGLITEGRVAAMFVEAHRNDLRFDHDVGKWFVFDGTRWKLEKTKLGYRWAHEMAATMAADTEDARTILGAGKAAFASGVEKIAQTDRAVAVTSEIWDCDPWLLGTPNGTVDLKTGILRPAALTDYITKSTAIGPADTPDCPMWLAFLDQACGGDAVFIRFLRQWCGYNRTGSIQEHAILFIHGPGGNGKSVWMNTIAHVLGDYCTTAAMDTFIETKGDRHPTDLAALRGARMVCAAETDEGRHWSELRIKQLTGGDKIAARFMRQDFFEFYPQFKLTVIGNHQPELRNVDEAARRRVNMGPFIHKPTSPDKTLEEKLRAEWSSILRWMIDGCLDWQMNGLIRPDVVTACTAEYFSNQDVVGQWVDDKCERTGTDTFNSLLTSWRNYAQARGEDPGSSKSFGMAMRRMGFKPIRNELGISGRGFQGIKVSVYSEPPRDDDYR